MRKIRLLAVLTVMLTCFTIGCGTEVEEVVSKEQTASVEMTKNTDEQISDETEQTEEKEDIEEVVDEPEEVKHEILGVPQNNGGHFVGCEDWIYYIEPGDASMQKPQLFAHYLDYYCGENVLQAYNVKTGSLVPLFTDNIYGKMWISGNVLFVNAAYPDDEVSSKVLMYELVTKEQTSAEGNQLLKGDEFGTYVLTISYSDTGNQIHVYRDGYERSTIDASDMVELVAVGEGYAVMAYYCDEEYTIGLKSVDLESGQETALGVLPLRDGDVMENYPEFEQWKISDGTLYLSVCFYEGTGHFFAEQEWIMADIKLPDSVTQVKVLSNDYEGNNEEPKAFVVKNGNMESADGEPMRGFINQSTGEYGYTDENGKAVVSGHGFEFQMNDVGLVFECECMEYVNGTVYAYNNNLVREPGEDIGWREAYVRSYTSIFCENVGMNDGYNIISYINPDYINGD